MPTDPSPRPPCRAAICAAASLVLCCVTLSQPAHAAEPAAIPTPITPATLTLSPLTSAAVVYADLPASTGFDQAAIDPAVAEPGDILQTGIASWYGHHWRGRRTASGTRFNPEAMTAASPTLPLGTRVWVTLEGTARSVLVTITDRQGAAHRVIDLSLAAARRIGIIGQGTARVVLRRA